MLVKDTCKLYFVLASYFLLIALLFLPFFVPRRLLQSYTYSTKRMSIEQSAMVQ